MDSLPEKMKECIKTGDEGKLKEFLSKLPKEATDYLTRCVQSGSFKPSAKDTNEK